MTITRFLPPPRALPIWVGVLVFLLAALHGCTPEPREPDPPPPGIDYSVLPPITQEGKNTFGCKVNGVVWVPRVELLVPWYDKLFQLHEKDNKGAAGMDCIVLTNDTDNFFSMAFGPTYYKTGVFQDIEGLSFCGGNFRLTDGTWYNTIANDTLNNRVQVTYLDTARNIISGTFQFKMYNDQNPGDSLVITEGRFDMPYLPE